MEASSRAHAGQPGVAHASRVHSCRGALIHQGQDTDSKDLRPFTSIYGCFRICGLLLALAGCRPESPVPPASRSVVRAAAVISQPASLRAPVPPSRPAIDVLKVRPNELGRIPVLMYHAIGAPAYHGTRYDRNGLNIAPETFRKQLQMMYAAGWYPVNMRDVVTPRIDVPAGKIPVVLTFDDARGTQLRYRHDGTMDPDCAVAILEQFHADHPDWPLRASFYVLPKSRWNPVPFYQPGTEAKKLRYLVEQGFEVANHSTSHRRMDRMDAHLLQWEMAECIRYVKARAPGATMDTMALPMGYVPRPPLMEYLLHGADGGTAYTNRCVLRAWGGPTLPPAHCKFDRRKIERIGASPGYVEMWIRHLKRGSSTPPFISDGDPNTVTIPKSAAKNLDRRRLDGAQVVVYDDSPPKKKPQPQKPRKGGSTHHKA